MNERHDDGGPAFPRPATLFTTDRPYNREQEGMSLRDWFAGKALQSVLAARAAAFIAVSTGEMHADVDNTDPAVAAYDYADRMLAARKRP
jgi:hypothetical protein